MIATRSKTYLSEVAVIGGSDIQNCTAEDAGIASVVQSGSAVLASTDQLERLLLPVFRGNELVSVVDFHLSDPSIAVGVTEIWEPVGVYDEVRLTAGSFGKLDRFQNVSSFVRFEKGNGLPGQVWATEQGVIHDNLANHPGFLRAAGASAGSLQTALGMPVQSDKYKATVVFIGSQKTPIATACEVWSKAEDHFELKHCSYATQDDTSSFQTGEKLACDAGLIGLINDHHGAVVSSDAEVLMTGRPDGNPFAKGVAIPSYVEQEIASVTKLFF